MSSINLNCDVCGREVQGITFVNGMKFCAKCYQETFGNNTNQFVYTSYEEPLRKQISDLQSQLAEKEKEYKYKLKEMDNEYKKEFKTFEEDCKHLYKTPTQKAIEQLEKLKYTININQIDNGYTDKQVDLDEFNETIDQQINELKGRVEDVKG